MNDDDQVTEENSEDELLNAMQHRHPRRALEIEEDNQDSRNEAGRSVSSIRNLYPVGVLFLLTACLYADQNLMGPNLSAIAEEFNMTDEERDWKLGGQIGFGFFLVGAPIALIVGFLADRVDRRRLFVGVVFFGEVPVLLTLLADRYWQLFVLRVLTGVSIGGAVPLTLSLLADYFPAERRSAVSGAWGIATGAGVMAGQTISGLVGPVWGWRSPFAVVSIPAMLLALVMLFTTEEPARGQFDGARSGPASKTAGHIVDCTKVRRILSIPTNVLGFLQGIPGCFPWGVVFAYLADYLANDKGLGVHNATAVMTAFGVGGLIGGLGGGLLGQYLYNINKKYVPLLMGCSTILGIIPCAYLINVQHADAKLGWICFVSFVAGCIATITGSNIRAIMLNVNTPTERGTVFAIFALTDDVGKGLSPLVAAMLISASGGRTQAFNYCMLGWLGCGLLLLGQIFTVERDVRTMHKRLLREDELLGFSRSLSSDT